MLDFRTDVMDVKMLQVIPFASADNATQQELQLRGEKYWMLLNRGSANHMGYYGYNAENDHFLVILCLQLEGKS